MKHLFCSAALMLLAAGSAFAGVDNAALSDDADGRDWPAWGRSFSEQRYSPLDQIHTGNVGKLGLAWSLELDEVWNVSSQPLAIGGVIYTAVGYSRVYAIDAASGSVLWQYDPKVDSRKMRMAWGSRGLAFWNDKLITGVQDGRLFALDAKTGEKVWEVLTTAPGDNRYITGAPRVWRGKDGRGRVIIGHGGADFGHVRGYVTAYDADTGEQLWRWWTVPGNPAEGFENAAMAMAAKTWSGDWWKFGAGGTVWNAMTYDPEYNRVYLGTGNGSPWNAQLRNPDGGDSLFLCSVVALDADSGEYAWHYQTTPNETWDYNSSMDMVTATLELDGEPRKVLMHAPKNGFFYVLDREDGALISAEKIGKVTWAERIDLATGRPVEIRGARYENGPALVWPGSGGTHNWHPMAYSPDTGLVYIPAREMPGIFDGEGRKAPTWQMTPDDVLGLKGFFDDVPKNAGSTSLLAWNPVTQKQAWRNPTPGATAGGVIVTRGGLVFQGLADGRFVATDAKTGTELWSHPMGVGTQAPPLTYEVDGRQYVAVLAGWGGATSLLGSLSAQHGWVGRQYPRRLLAFALDGTAKLPDSPPPLAKVEPIDDPAFVVDAAKASAGRNIYARQCTICHGTAVVAGGYAPDLRASKVSLSAEAFKAIVQGGALEARGMPKFEEFSDADLEAMRHYIRQRARHRPSLLDQLGQLWEFITLMIRMELAKRGW